MENNKIKKIVGKKIEERETVLYGATWRDHTETVKLYEAERVELPVVWSVVVQTGRVQELCNDEQALVCVCVCAARS